MSLSNRITTVAIVVLGFLMFDGKATARQCGTDDKRIRDLIVAIFPKYRTADYRLAFKGSRLIGLNAPVGYWFFSVEPSPVPPGLGYVYQQTSTPCGKDKNYPEGACVLPSQLELKQSLVGRATVGFKGGISVEVSAPDITERNRQIKASLPAELSEKVADRILLDAGARFPPSQRDDFASYHKNLALLSYLKAKIALQPKFCTHRQESGSSYPALYWQSVLRSGKTFYVATFEPVVGNLTSLLETQDWHVISNACQQ